MTNLETSEWASRDRSPADERDRRIAPGILKPPNPMPDKTLEELKAELDVAKAAHDDAENAYNKALNAFDAADEALEAASDAYLKALDAQEENSND